MGQWTIHHPAVFVLTFLSYSLFHAVRKTLSNVKNTLADEWTPSEFDSNATVKTGRLMPDDGWNSRHFLPSQDSAEEFLGALDAAFLFAYALGLYVSGSIADRHDLRVVLSIGMWLTALVVFIFGPLFEWLYFYSEPAYIAVMVVNGLLQSLAWPSVVAVMGNWFGKGSRGLVLGIWSACASVGNIIGALLVSLVVDYGYEYAFLLTSCLLFACGIVVFFGLVPTPRDVGLPLPDEEDAINVKEHISMEGIVDEKKEDVGFKPDSETKNNPDTRPKAINFCTALLLPGVIPYSLAYAFLKLVNYSFFFWLPFYLSSAYQWRESTADQLSTWYDVGGIIGGSVAGFISDRLQKRAVVVVPMLVLGIPMLFVYSTVQAGSVMTINAIMLCCTGVLIGGVANLISAAISADLGRQDAIRGNSEALSTVTGIVDGTGSLGAAIGQVALPYLQVTFNWRAVFYLFMAATLLTIVCILPMVIAEARDLWKRARNGKLDKQTKVHEEGC